MHWMAPSEKDAATDTLEQRLWEAADQLRANSGLTAQQYSQPVLGLIFLRFAETRFLALRKRLAFGRPEGLPCGGRTVPGARCPVRALAVPARAGSGGCRAQRGHEGGGAG